MTTIISFDKPASELPTKIKNWSELPQSVQAQLLTCDYYVVRNNIELVFYKGRTMEISCSYTELYDHKLITHAYNRHGDMFQGKYELDYEKWATTLDTEHQNNELRSLVRKLAAELEDATSFMETMEEYAEEHEHNADDEWIRKTSKNNLVKIAERILNGEVVEETRCAACLNNLPENTKPYEDTKEHFCSQNCLETLYEDAIPSYYN
ncbi:hypothetical protein HB667_26910 [Bacillus cereus]|uniref:hypothetical protein n=1 Tax=Bacillus cereus group TaxID=86661 RepID=UPI001443EE70|nr:hypothetical protein [Bacillus cereus]NKW77446.1 hypothetical protein [Bacillus cereus]NKX14864.1 hypothetical protein [Bacillus cereus]